MVQIVGKDPAAIKRVTCKGCASLLEYTLSEVTSFNSTDYSGCSDDYHYITCPGCSKRVYVKGY